jgi:hypothetical protein
MAQDPSVLDYGLLKCCKETGDVSTPVTVSAFNNTRLD